MIRWLLSLFRHRPVIVRGWRTCDSGKRFRKPEVWMSYDHLAVWGDFLRDMLKRGRLTPKLYRKKIRDACRSIRQQIREAGGLPDRIRPIDREEYRALAQEIWRKADRA